MNFPGNLNIFFAYNLFYPNGGINKVADKEKISNLFNGTNGFKSLEKTNNFVYDFYSPINDVNVPIYFDLNIINNRIVFIKVGVGTSLGIEPDQIPRLVVIYI